MLILYVELAPFVVCASCRSMWLVSVLIGIFFDDLVYVFALIGALFASPMSVGAN